MTSHSRRHPPRPSNEFDPNPTILLTPLPPSSLFTAPLNPLSLSHIHSPISLTLRVALTRYKWEWSETKKVEFERWCESFRSRFPRWWKGRVRVWVYLRVSTNAVKQSPLFGNKTTEGCDCVHRTERPDSFNYKPPSTVKTWFAIVGLQAEAGDESAGEEGLLKRIEGVLMENSIGE